MNDGKEVNKNNKFLCTGNSKKACLPYWSVGLGACSVPGCCNLSRYGECVYGHRQTDEIINIIHRRQTLTPDIKILCLDNWKLDGDSVQTSNLNKNDTSATSEPLTNYTNTRIERCFALR